MSPSDCHDPLTPLGQVVAEARLGGQDYREALYARLRALLERECSGRCLDDDEDLDLVAIVIARELTEA